MKSVGVPSRRPPVARAPATLPRAAGSDALGDRSFVRSFVCLNTAGKLSTVPDQVRHEIVNAYRAYRLQVQNQVIAISRNVLFRLYTVVFNLPWLMTLQSADI